VIPLPPASFAGSSFIVRKRDNVVSQQHLTLLACLLLTPGIGLGSSIIVNLGDLGASCSLAHVHPAPSRTLLAPVAASVLLTLASPTSLRIATGTKSPATMQPLTKPPATRPFSSMWLPHKLDSVV